VVKVIQCKYDGLLGAALRKAHDLSALSARNV
jgi:hypothetical protein